MPIFIENKGKLQKLKAFSVDKEKHLQRLIEGNLSEVLDMYFLETEYATTKGGRIDTLAIDSSGCPIIIEYKRHKNDNIINQGLSYLRWLTEQKSEFFEKLVENKLDKKIVDKIKIDWKNPRVICIALSFNKFDIDTVEVLPIRIELFKYRFYENNLLSLDPFNIALQKPTKTKTDDPVRTENEYEIDIHYKKGSESTIRLFEELRSRVLEIDQNIEEKVTAIYIAYKVANNFAMVQLQKKQIWVNLRPIDYVDPKNKVIKISEGYQWKLDRRIYIKSLEDIENAMKLIEASYQDVL